MKDQQNVRGEYEKPQVKTIGAKEVIENLGPAMAGYGDLDPDAIP